MQPWLKENPQADFAELEKVFGAPEAIAAAYLDEMRPEEILTKLSEKRKTIAVVAATCILALIIVAAVMITTSISLQQTATEGPMRISIQEEVEERYP